MLITMGISLYTSRIILNALGVNDFGIYNVVGGIVIMFGFLNSAMASGTSRFLTFELGRQNFEELKRVFSMSMNVHILIAIIVLILAETIGLWFLNYKLVIPIERLDAANWVYQCSIIVFILNIIQVPYNSSIISHEKMSIYAYISIIEVLLKLLIVYLLLLVSVDKLKLYALLISSVSIIIIVINRIYCLRKFSECKYNFFWDKNLFKKLSSYGGWDIIGNLSVIVQNQGLNILINIFYGPVVNAARAISYQIYGAVYSFVTNFMMAANPQIIKYYAQNEKEKMKILVLNSSKFSFLLMWLISIPVIINTKTILRLWLKIVPEYTVIFVNLILIIGLLDAIRRPFVMATHAIGVVKKQSTICGTILILSLPISYIFFKLSYSPVISMIVVFVLSFISFIAEYLIVREKILITIKELYDFIFKHIAVLFLLLLVFLFFCKNIQSDNLIYFFFSTLIVSVLNIAYIFIFAFNRSQRFYLLEKIRFTLRKIFKI